jgi:hypothetical protein
LGLVVLLLALRDVPTGASGAKWLLGLRLVGPNGGRLPLGARLLRAPVSLLPLEWLAGERRGTLPWRVVSYVPSAAGLGVRVALALATGACCVGFGVQSLRPSIGRADALRLASDSILADPLLRRTLGDPLEVQVRRIEPRNRLALRGTEGQFELRIQGPRARQDMRVRALKVEGRWAVDEIVDIDISSFASAGRDTVASR